MPFHHIHGLFRVSAGEAIAADVAVVVVAGAVSFTSCFCSFLFLFFFSVSSKREVIVLLSCILFMLTKSRALTLNHV